LCRAIDGPLLKRLEEIVGPKSNFSDEELLQADSHDETIGLSHQPEVVVKTASRPYAQWPGMAWGKQPNMEHVLFPIQFYFTRSRTLGL
jgi:hypothetical protein